jgi:hypothetical protein
MTAEKPVHPQPSGPARQEPPQRPERRFTILLIVTAATLAFIGTTIGALVLAYLSGAPTGLAVPFFPSHPYLQIYGFVTEFVIGVAYSLLPRFKVGRFPDVSLGYLIYGTVTCANVLFVVSAVIGHGQSLDILGSILILSGSLAYLYQVVELVRRPKGGFPETDPLIILSSVSLVLISILLLLGLEGMTGRGEVFSPELIFLALVGFAGSEVYAVQIRSVSFRQCNYRKRMARLASILQSAAVAAIFAAAVFPTLILQALGGALFLAAAFCVLFSIKILELAHPLMLRPAMTKMHYTIMHYNEVCILSAAAWLLFGCIAGIALMGFDLDSFFVRDSFIHSLAVGFIGSNIACFAPMLLPGLLGKKGPVTGLSYGPIALLDAGVMVRLAGNFETLQTSSPPLWESISGLLVIAAMVWFLVMLKNVGRKPPAAAAPTIRAAGPFTIDSAANAIEIRLTVTGRKTAREFELPTWFVFKDGAVWLLPVKGQSTGWYKNILHTPRVKVGVAGHSVMGSAQQVTDSRQVRRVIDWFRDKYSDRNYQNFYANRVDVAVKVALDQV